MKILKGANSIRLKMKQEVINLKCPRRNGLEKQMLLG